MLSWECSDSSASLPTCCGAYGPVVYTGYLEEGLISSTDEASMLVACICLHTICNSGMCVFIWFFPLFFLTEVFWRGFFPMGMLATCPVFCWFIPGLSVGFSLCIVWTLFCCFASISVRCPIPFIQWIGCYTGCMGAVDER